MNFTRKSIFEGFLYFLYIRFLLLIMFLIWQDIQGWSLGRLVAVLFGIDASLALNIAAVRYCTLSSMFELRSISFSRSLSDNRVRYLSKSA